MSNERMASDYNSIVAVDIEIQALEDRIEELKEKREEMAEISKKFLRTFLKEQDDETKKS